MQTSCPECRTTFRVSQDQLGLRRGLVRCGKCNAVFNAYDTLLPELEDLPESRVGEGEAEDAMHGTEANAATHPSAVGERATTEHGARAEEAESAASEAEVQGRDTSEALPETHFETIPETLEELSAQEVLAAYLEHAAAPEAEEEQGGAAQDIAHAEGAQKDAARLAADTPDAILLSELPNRRSGRARLPRWKAALYLLTVMLLALALLVQWAYFLRAELAASLPEARPVLNALCRPLHCSVPLARQLTRQAIVSSSLEHDAEQKSRVRLSVLLANRTGQVQDWPHLLLTLSDVRESPVAQQAFAAETYLPRGISARAGFPPQSEQEVALELDIGSLAAASYVVTVAYP